MKKLPLVRQPSAQPSSRSFKKVGLTPLSAWDWADSQGILANIKRTFETLTAKSDFTPYARPDACFRRIVYRAGRAGMVHRDRVRFFADLNEKQKGRGRRSADMFATLLRSTPQGASDGLSKANINKIAATMRTAHDWDIDWRFYDLVVTAVGAVNITGQSRKVVDRPRWADGLTSAAQAATKRACKAPAAQDE